MTQAPPAKALLHPYDEVAEKYDEIWGGIEALEEDRAIMMKINYQGGSVLDIGCGTGLFLDHHPGCNPYLGLDPSRAMLDKLEKKHGDSSTIKSTFEALAPELASYGHKYDYVLSLFGSPSYIPQNQLEQVHSLVKPGGKLFMMFIAPGYSPKTHEYITAPPSLHQYDFSIFGKVTRFGNYIITEA